MSATKTTPSATLTDLLFERAGDGLCLVAPDGTVVRANAEWLRLTGFTAEQVPGENILDLFPATRDVALAMHARARAGHRVEVPLHAQIVNGRERWWQGSIEPVPMAGGAGLLITAREVVPSAAPAPVDRGDAATASVSGAAGEVEPVEDGPGRPQVATAVIAAWAVSALGVVAALIGAVYLAAWLAGIAGRWSEAGVITMKANMALAVVLAGTALLLQRVPSPWARAAAVAAAALVLAIGVLTLAEHALGIDLHIDQLLATERPGAVGTGSPNRLGIPGAVSLTLLGAGLLAVAWRRRASVYFGVATLVVVLFPAVGYLYRISALYASVDTTAIAWPTVVALSAVAFGVVLSDSPDHPKAFLLSRDVGAAMLRRMLPVVVVAPLLVGLAVRRGEQLGLYNADIGDAVAAVAAVVVFAALLWVAARDVSRSAARRARAEEALERNQERLRVANQELHEASRRKDEFLGMLSHELRNPLAPIRNASYVLRHAPPASAQAERAQAVIERQTEHLTRLVDDLLDVTRIARGKIELRRAQADLRELILRAADDFRALFDERGVRFRVVVAEGALPAQVDSTRLTQVVGNLLHNASKFTRRGDEVTLTLTARGAEAEIRVRDTGAGIEAALLPHVFDAFVQADRTLARTEGGLGLGLALVKGVVELHGGSVHAGSAGRGQGAEFVVRLPLGDAAAGAGSGDERVP
jgi:PAS domain S-box-containing protein